MITWTLSVDRRKANRDEIIEALNALEAGVQGLSITIFDDEHYWNAPDHGAFRDFVPFATVTHAQRAGLEYVAEDLLEQFGWLVDFRPPQDAHDEG